MLESPSLIGGAFYLALEITSKFIHFIKRSLTEGVGRETLHHENSSIIAFDTMSIYQHYRM
jgi:hypothetical protein